MTVKQMILQANENIKETAKILATIYHDIEFELDPSLIENSNMALGELIKCIKHLALINGNITGDELMPREGRSPKPEMTNDEQAKEALGQLVN